MIFQKNIESKIQSYCKWRFNHRLTNNMRYAADKRRLRVRKTAVAFGFMRFYLTHIPAHRKPCGLLYKVGWNVAYLER